MSKADYLRQEEARLLEVLATLEPGSASYDDVVKQLERISNIKREDFEAESKSRNEAERIEVENKKSKRDTAVRAGTIGAGLTLGGLLLWFEDSGNFIRSKVFSWLKFFR